MFIMYKFDKDDYNFYNHTTNQSIKYLLLFNACAFFCKLIEYSKFFSISLEASMVFYSYLKFFINIYKYL